MRYGESSKATTQKIEALVNEGLWDFIEDDIGHVCPVKAALDAVFDAYDSGDMESFVETAVSDAVEDMLSDVGRTVGYALLRKVRGAASDEGRAQIDSALEFAAAKAWCPKVIVTELLAIARWGTETMPAEYLAQWSAERSVETGQWPHDRLAQRVAAQSEPEVAGVA